MITQGKALVAGVYLVSACCTPLRTSAATPRLSCNTKMGIGRGGQGLRAAACVGLRDTVLTKRIVPNLN